MTSTTSKINSILGIKNNQTIDDFLNEMDNDSNSITETMSNISDNIKSTISNIDNSLSALEGQQSVNSPQLLTNIDSSMKEVEDLISTSKKIFKHIYEGIITSELIDSELVGSLSKLLEAIHINIAEFINLYKERARYIDKIKIMVFQQKQKMDIMERKHQMELEKLKIKSESKAIDVQADEVIFDQNKLIEMLDDIDQKDNDINI